ncbi:MAG TPA: D-xylose transporter subunit XylF, partial [Bacillota bacterium]|nr:D-xylose transporter subunit XylF [Bacillota bacterium]
MAKENKVKNSIIVVLFTIFLMLILSIASILNKTDRGFFQSDTNIEEREKIKIGFSLGTLKEERWIKDRDILIAKAREFGAD